MQRRVFVRSIATGCVILVLFETATSTEPRWHLPEQANVDHLGGSNSSVAITGTGSPMSE